MVLRALELQGFKSFPDRTVLKLGTGITAVVGPNGSGKSNISDAIRWVLGEQRTKSLRGSKMEDVIFGGTSTRRSLGYAQVTLTLDNSDRTLIEKGNTVSVGRRYYRSGESEYKIDGETVRRKDIRELFMDTGLGSNGYSMVGQGKIDSIISQKNEERRELFEEAAGISRFRSKRTDAQRKLEQAQENLVRLLDILKELEGRVEPLRVQSEKAGRFLELAGEKKELEIGLWLYKINKFTQELREQERRIDAAQLSYAGAEKELALMEAEVESVMNQASLLSVEMDEIRRSRSAYEEEALRHDGEIQVLENNILHNDETIARISGEMNEAQGQNSTIDLQIEENRVRIAAKEAYIAEQRCVLEQATASVAKLQSENAHASQRSAEISGEIAALTMKLSDSKVRASRALSSADEIRSRQGTVDTAIAEGEHRLALLHRQKEESVGNVTFLEERIAEYSNALNGYQLRMKQRSERAEKSKQELDKLRMGLTQKLQRTKMLRDLEKHMEGYSGAVKLVMKQASNGALTGVLGPVSQLIQVDSDYSVAIETALGAAMQNIVTQTEADAKRAILCLKNQKAGRATFLPVSAIKGRSLTENGLDDCLGYVDRAVNLVQCDPKYKEIIASLLGKTVVVEDMDCAIGIAKRYHYRFRIVTLDGQVMNAGGSMTGGSRTQNTGILSRGNEIERLDREAKTLEADIEKQKTAQKEIVEELAKARADYEGASADLTNATEDKIRAEGEDRLVQEQLAAAQRSMTALQEEKGNAQGRMRTLIQEQAEAEAEINTLSAALEAAGGQLAEISDSSELLAKQREETGARMNAINLDIMTAVKDAENAKMVIDDLAQRKSSQSGRLDSIQAEIAAIRTRSEQICGTIEQVKERAAALRAKSAATESEIQSLHEKRAAFEKKSGELRLLERTRTADREKLSTELGRLEERRDAMTKEYEDTVNKLYDEYQLTRAEAENVGSSITDIPRASRRLNELKSGIRALGSVNVGAIEEYKEVSERYTFLNGQINDIEKSRVELSKIIEELTRSMSEKFRVQFEKINQQFKVCFADFFGGGNGELVLEDAQNVLESPIEIKIQPPGKSVQNINLFSGGEKALAAMALLFSVLKVTPAPFCVYDEVEAALDDVNVDRFAKYMRKMTDKTQFISITHRRGTMEEADVLYGVTMQEKGVSKLLELHTTELAEKLGVK